MIYILSFACCDFFNQYACSLLLGPYCQLLFSPQASFRALVGTGYQTLQSLLLDFCHWHPTEGLLNALLDMLVDGRFDVKANNIIKVTISLFKCCSCFVQLFF